MSTYTAKCDICGAENPVSFYGDWHCKQCGQGYEYDECPRISLTAAQWALLRNPPRWIPVSERLPDEGADVLAYSAAIGTQVAHLDGKSWYWGTSGILGFDATHWMPLPEPPTE